MSIKAVLIDSREPKWVQELKFDGTMVAVTQLEYGDVWATTADGALLCVERKTVSDFLSSVRDERLWLQLAGLRKQSPWAYLVITGLMQVGPGGKLTTERGRTGWDWASVQGMILKAQELGAYVVMAPSDLEFEATILRIAERGRTPEMVLKPARMPTILSPAEQLLASLPGIGLGRAESLLRYSGTPANALAFLTDMEFPHGPTGIGRFTKEKVREALGLKEGMTLAVVSEKEES